MPTPELATTLTVTDDDRLLQAEADVRGYCGWHIAPVRTDEVVTVLDPPYSTVLMLPTMMLSSVASVTEDGTTVDPTTYTVDPRGWLTRTDALWSTGPIVVTMTHGYATVPADVQGVVQSVAHGAIDGRTGAQSWSRTRGPFAESASYGPTGGGRFTAAERQTLSRYRIPRGL